MKEWLNQECNIEITRDNKKLNYTAKTVTDISNGHITFIDRYNDLYTYRISDVTQINKRGGDINGKKKKYIAKN